MARISYKDAYNNESIIAQMCALSDKVDNFTGDADDALEKATEALEKVTTVETTADTALSTATEASSAAATADAKAVAADGKADIATATANTANTNAAQAVTTANSAMSKATACETDIAELDNSVITGITTVYANSVLTTTLARAGMDALVATATIQGGGSGGSSGYTPVTTFSPSDWSLGDIALFKIDLYDTTGASSSTYYTGTVKAKNNYGIRIETNASVSSTIVSGFDPTIYIYGGEMWFSDLTVELEKIGVQIVLTDNVPTFNKLTASVLGVSAISGTLYGRIGSG